MRAHAETISTIAGRRLVPCEVVIGQRWPIDAGRALSQQRSNEVSLSAASLSWPIDAFAPNEPGTLGIRTWMQRLALIFVSLSIAAFEEVQVLLLCCC
jgi:hypothetical protein